MADRPTRRPGETLFVLALVAAGAAAVVEAQRLGGLSDPSGPGIFPMLASLVLVVSALVLLWRRVPAEAAAVERLRRFGREVVPLRVLAVIGLILAYVVAMPTVGFMAATGAFLVVVLRLLWDRGWLAVLTLTAFSLAVIHLVFRIVFQVVLPAGRLGSLW